jgi:APA family basic amino acid/polyamine antiporter
LNLGRTRESNTPRFRAPPVAGGARSSAEGALVRAVGTVGLAAGIVNLTIGGGIFRLPSGVAALVGPAAPLAYLVCAGAMALVVLCFAEAASRVSLTGGVYAYVEVAFGPLAGFVTGILLWVGLTAALAAVSSFFADSVAALVPALASANAKRAVLLAVFALLAGLNVRGVRGASRFNTVLTAAKLVPLLVLIVFGFLALRPENLRWASTPPSGQIARASLLLIFAFLGIEAALVPGGEVRDPARTAPRAIFLAMVAIVAIYLAIQIAAQGVLGPSLATQATPLAAAAGIAAGPWGRNLILVGSSLSMFGYVSGMTLSVPRMLFAFARDGFLPSSVASVHPRFRTPHVAIVLQAAIAALLALTGSFEPLAILANGSVLVVYAGCCLAALELRRRDVRLEGGPPAFRGPAMAVVPWLALAVIVWLLASLRPGEWIAVLAAAAAAVLAYFVARRRTNVATDPGRG